MATAIVTANSRNTRPTMPPIKSTGMNTAISEKVMAMMVKPISLDPLSAASNGRMPPSIWRTIFSSIKKPTDSVSASNVILLMEKLSAYMTAQVPMRETGTARAGMIVAGTERRNRKITRITSEMAIPSVISTSLTEFRIETDRSARTSRSIAAGTWAR